MRGLFVLDPVTNTIRGFPRTPDNPASIGNKWIGNLYQDRQERIWIGGQHLQLWKPETGSFAHYTEPAFTGANQFEPVGSDYRGRVWVKILPGGVGIFEPSTGKFFNFDITDGIVSPLSMRLLETGKIMLVGSGGMNIIHPDSIYAPENPPPVVLTRLTVNDTGNIPAGNINDMTSLRLPYDMNVIELEFAAIDPAASHLIKYQYLLEGLEEKWIDAQERRYVRYPNLDPGEYIFRVKASNKFGRWNEQEIAFVISIIPPWWKTWWAYTIYGSLLIGFAFSGYRLRLRQIYLKQHAEMEHFQAERLAEVDRLKSRFFANISHEFRTPLTLILGPAEQLLESNKDSAVQQKLSLIKNNASKLYALVGQLLDFSKVESGAMKLQVSKGEIIGFMRRIVLSFESWAERKKVDLQFKSIEESAQGFFDSEKIEKIMNNLLSNALKFTPEGGRVTVTLSLSDFDHSIPLLDSSRAESRDRERNHRVRVTVSDTGPGIPLEHLPHIFNRFYRAEDTHHIEGTGIGLALVWELVQIHHGGVTVESIPGKGSEFTVTLPIDQTAYKPEEIVKSHPVRESGEQVNLIEFTAKETTSVSLENGIVKPIVLVVEDNTELRAYISEFLKTDYTVHEAGDGKVGFTQATETIPDIIISDVMMPMMDGLDLCRVLKQDVRTSHVPVILLTARAGTDSKIEGLEIGADDYITKPFEPKELQARVKNLIEQRKQLRKKFSAGVVLKPGEVAVNSLDHSLLKKVMKCVENNIGNEDFDVDDLANEACLSRRQLDRKLQALTNLAPLEFIQYIRLQRARQLLEKNTGSIADIAYQVGFQNPSYFSKRFRERFGISPSDLPHIE
jgi:signal transduction histidine kinase/DNA-binding response OmpR family regulator